MGTTATDCIVAGGGLLGILSARQLAREGITVRLLERRRLCRESSWAGGGILSPLYPWQYPDAVSELVAWSQAHYPRLAQDLLEETGIDIQLVRSGMLLLDVHADAAISRWLQRYGVAAEALDAPALQAADSELRAGCMHALLLPNVAQVRNPRLGQALALSLAGLGVDVQENCEVTALRVRQGVVQGVDTSAGTFTSQRVVIAGGAWSAQLVTGLGLELAVEPVRGQMIQFETPPGLLRHIVLDRDCYLIPRRDGLLLAGSTLERVGFNRETTAEARRFLQQRACEILPALSGMPLVRHWSGLRPASPQGIPYIGPSREISGLYFNTGHYRNGVVMAPASAQLLTDSILGRPGLTDLAPYRPPAPAKQVPGA